MKKFTKTEIVLTGILCIAAAWLGCNWPGEAGAAWPWIPPDDKPGVITSEFSFGNPCPNTLFEIVSAADPNWDENYVLDFGSPSLFTITDSMPSSIEISCDGNDITVVFNECDPMDIFEMLHASSCQDCNATWKDKAEYYRINRDEAKCEHSR